MFNKINTFISTSERDNFPFDLSKLTKDQQNYCIKILTYLYTVKDPRICYKTRELKLPSIEERQKILKDFHSNDNGHLGINKMTRQISQVYTWPLMGRDILNFVNRCKKCQLAKRAQFNNKADGVFIAPPSQFN